MEADSPCTSIKTSLLLAIDCTLKFVTCKLKINTYLTICSVYCPPDSRVIYDEFLLCRIVYHIRNFDAQPCGAASRGGQVLRLINDSDLAFLNDGSPTWVDGNNGNLSFTDISLVS